MSLYPDQHPVSACQRPQATPNLLPYWETSIRIRTITYLDLSATIWGNVTLASNLSSFFATLNFEHIPIQTKMSWSCGCSVQKLFSSVWGRADYSAECWPGKTLQLLRSSAWSIIIITTGGFYISPPPPLLPAPQPIPLCGVWWFVVRTQTTHTHSSHPSTLRKTYWANQFVSNHRNWHIQPPSTQHSTKYFVFQELFFWFSEKLRSGAEPCIEVSDLCQEQWENGNIFFQLKSDRGKVFLFPSLLLRDISAGCLTISSQDDPPAGPPGGHTPRYDWQHCQYMTIFDNIWQWWPLCCLQFYQAQHFVDILPFLWALSSCSQVRLSSQPWNSLIVPRLDITAPRLSKQVYHHGQNRVKYLAFKTTKHSSNSWPRVTLAKIPTSLHHHHITMQLQSCNFIKCPIQRERFNSISVFIHSSFKELIRWELWF